MSDRAAGGRSPHSRTLPECRASIGKTCVGALARAWGRSYEGVLVVKRGDFITGLRLLRAAFEELGTTNVVFRYLTFLGEMPEAVSRTGQIPLWLAAIEEALAWTEQTESRWPIAALLRDKGELLLLQGARSRGGS